MSHVPQDDALDRISFKPSLGIEASSVRCRTGSPLACFDHSTTGGLRASSHPFSLSPRNFGLNYEVPTKSVAMLRIKTVIERYEPNRAADDCAGRDILALDNIQDRSGHVY